MDINSIQQLAFVGIIITGLLLLIAFLTKLTNGLCLLLDFPLNFYEIETILDMKANGGQVTF